MSAIIKQKLNHDSMWISAKFPSGASLKWRIGRGGERLEIAFSNDTTTRNDQAAKLNKWLGFREGEKNADRFNRLEELMKGCRSGSEVIAKINSNE
jgi:hypothetical protein